MSPDKPVDKNDPSTWVAMTKVAPVKFTKWFLFKKTYTEEDENALSLRWVDKWQLFFEIEVNGG